MDEINPIKENCRDYRKGYCALSMIPFQQPRKCTFIMGCKLYHNKQED